MVSPFLAGMKAEFDDLKEEWGKETVVKRFISSLNAQGRLSGSFTTVLSGEIMWVQPAAGSSEVEDLGIDELTTHLAFQKFSGTAMQAKDRVTVTGDAFDYDVVRVHIKESHRVNELKQIKRT